MSTQPNFLDSFILVDSTLVARRLSLLFILLRRDPSQGSWHELWLLFTADNPFIFKLKWKILHVFLCYIRVCIIGHHIVWKTELSKRQKWPISKNHYMDSKTCLKKKPCVLINFYQETVDIILKAKLLMDLKDINTTFLSWKMWALKIILPVYFICW